jgi:hypothetical protein
VDRSLEAVVAEEAVSMHPLSVESAPWIPVASPQLSGWSVSWTAEWMTPKVASSPNSAAALKSSEAPKPEVWKSMEVRVASKSNPAVS